MISRYCRLVPTLVLVAVLGCSSRPDVVPVQGEAFDKDKKPATGAIIIFHPNGIKGVADIRPSATVDENGTFQPTTYSANDGLPEGDYDVTVVWTTQPKGGTLIGGGEQRSFAVDRLGNRYSDPKKPQLKASIRKGETNTLRFDLK
jgi:hypothetical protein